MNGFCLSPLALNRARGTSPLCIHLKLGERSSTAGGYYPMWGFPKVSTQFWPFLVGISLSTSNACFISGPSFSAFSFQPPDLEQLLHPSHKANVPLTPTRFPVCCPFANPSKINSFSLMAQGLLSICWVVSSGAFAHPFFSTRVVH